MESKIYLADGTEIVAEINTQTVTSSGHAVPDPTWCFTDSQGHEHRYDASGELPTLTPVWQLGYCETCRDTHEEGEILDCYLCAQCGETIHPGTKWFTPPPFQLFGRISITHRGWVNLEVPPDWVNADWSVFTQIVNDRNGVRGYFEKYLTQAEAEELVERIRIRGR